TGRRRYAFRARYDRSLRHQLDVFRRRRRHLQPGARHPLDERMRGPGALLELQLAPLDLEIVALVVEPLQLHEELARAVLRIDRARGGAEGGDPERNDGDREELAGWDAHGWLTSRARRRGAWRCGRGDYGQSRQRRDEPCDPRA